MTDTIAPQRGFPTSAREGLSQYLRVGGERSLVVPDDPDERFGHLRAFVQHHALDPGDGERITPAHDEVVSDAFYVPDELKSDNPLLGEDDIFVAKSLFTLDGGARQAGAGQFRLGIVPIRDESRVNVLKTLVEEQGEVSVRHIDVGRRIVCVSGVMQGEGTEAKVVKPVVYERKNNKGKAEMIEHPNVSEAAKAVLRLFLTPDLDPEIKRAKLAVDDPRNFAFKFGTINFNNPVIP